MRNCNWTLQNGWMIHFLCRAGWLLDNFFFIGNVQFQLHAVIKTVRVDRVEYAENMIQGHQIVRVWNLAFRPDFGLPGYCEPEETETLLGLILTQGCLERNQTVVCPCQVSRSMSINCRLSGELFDSFCH